MTPRDPIHAIYIFWQQGLDTLEIARKIGFPEAYVWNNLTRARAMGRGREQG